MLFFFPFQRGIDEEDPLPPYLHPQEERALDADPVERTFQDSLFIYLLNFIYIVFIYLMVYIYICLLLYIFIYLIYICWSNSFI